MVLTKKNISGDILEAILKQLEDNLFIPIREWEPEIKIYSFHELQKDLRECREIIDKAQIQKAYDSAFFIASIILSVILVSMMIAFPKAADLIGLWFGFCFGSSIWHYRAINRQKLVIQEMNYLVPLLMRSLKMISEFGLAKATIVEVILKGDKEKNYVMVSPSGIIISFRFK